jgi:biotin operon repressor
MNEAVLAALRPGRSNARTIEQVAIGLGVARRDIEQAIERLRLMGIPIGAAGRNGVFVAVTAAELLPTEKSLQGRATTIYNTHAAVLATLRRMEACEAAQRLASADPGPLGLPWNEAVA